MRGEGVCLGKLVLAYPGVCSTECATPASVAVADAREAEGRLPELVDVDEEVARVRLREDVEEERRFGRV